VKKYVKGEQIILNRLLQIDILYFYSELSLFTFEYEE